MKTEDDTIISKGSAKKNTKNENIQVVVRCRPMSETELANNNEHVVTCYATENCLQLKNPILPSTHISSTKYFTFDAVYDSFSTQEEIYVNSVRPLVYSIFEGFNACVFAYGQTGTGKTYTIEGVYSDETYHGIIPRSFKEIWAHINKTKEMQFLVTVSYLEIYLENLRDLLAFDKKLKKNLEIRESFSRGLYVSDLHSITCTSADDMFQVMQKGNKNRSTASTRMNEHSSRSHAIFTITVEMRSLIDNSIKVGKLNLIDLAGSERQSKTGACDTQFREAININRGLSALGNVISALSENSSHIPYRDSKLTRLLQNSLGGNSKTIMIANIGPASYNYEETLTTLRYAQRAKRIKNLPIKNEDPNESLMKKLLSEIDRLKKLIEQRAHESEKVVIKKIKRKKIDEDDKFMNFESLQSETENVEKLLLEEKQVNDELASQLNVLESQLISGGQMPDLTETINERQQQLEIQLSEIIEKKKREEEMQELLIMESDLTAEMREGCLTLQQIVNYKTKKILKYMAKIDQMKKEIEAMKETHCEKVRSLELMLEHIFKDLKFYIMVIVNFILKEDKNFVIQNVRNEEGQLTLPPNVVERITHRPISNPYLDQPICEYAIKKIKSASVSTRYKAENLIQFQLDMPLKTTKKYTKPVISASLKAYLETVLKNENDLEIDDSVKGMVHAKTQAKMDLIANNLAIRQDIQRQPKIKDRVSASGKPRRSISSAFTSSK